MIDRDEVIAFFDSRARTWDENMVRCDTVIDAILDNASVTADTAVLDVACGTGVLFPDYLKRGVRSLTGIDISPEMVKCAKEKFSEDKVKIICGDVEETEFSEKFDVVMVYNAFPHFPDPERLIRKLAGLIKTGGVLSVAHGMSRDRINSCHKGAAHNVSNGLMTAEELKELFMPYFDIKTVISDDRMYQVAGIRNNSSTEANFMDEHKHLHEHHHDHEHTHEHHHHDGDGAEKLTAVLRYMLDHNIHHADELKGIVEKLKEQNLTEASDTLAESTALFDQANEKLAAALKLLGE